MRSRKKSRLSRAIPFLAVALACCFDASGHAQTSPDAPAVRATETDGSAESRPKRGEFLEISGPSLIYRGEAIHLRGINQNNIGALCSRAGRVKFGSCNIDDIDQTEADYAKMSELGMNHIRFGLSFSWYRHDRAKFFSVLDAHVALARKYRIWLVWNLFTTPADCYEGYAEHCAIWHDAAEQKALKDFWVDVARHYRNEPAVAGYGLLNEPTPPFPKWSAAWNELAEEIRSAIAQVHPKAIVVISATSSGRFPSVFPAKNVLYEVHDYIPLALTHARDPKLTYPGTAPDWNGVAIYWDKSTFSGGGPAAASLAERLSINWAQQNTVPLYIGEWGTNNIYRGYVDLIRDKADIYSNLFGANHAMHVWRGQAHQYALFPATGGFEPFDRAYLAAAKSAWKDARRPTF